MILEKEIEMGYYVDIEGISLEEFYNKVQEVSILPSQKCLKDMALSALLKFSLLDAGNVKQLRDLLKDKRRYKEYSNTTSVTEECLVLLKREIERYLPRAIAFKDIPGFHEDTLKKLGQSGLLKTSDVYELVKRPALRANFAEQVGISDAEALKVAQFVDLSRIMWSTPSFIMLLYTSGYRSLNDVLTADPQKMHEELSAVNEKECIIKSTLRPIDIELFIRYAEDVPNEMEW